MHNALSSYPQTSLARCHISFLSYIVSTCMHARSLYIYIFNNRWMKNPGSFSNHCACLINKVNKGLRYTVHSIHNYNHFKLSVV